MTVPMTVGGLSADISALAFGIGEKDLPERSILLGILFTAPAVIKQMVTIEGKAKSFDDSLEQSRLAVVVRLGYKV